ncbi:hypothetical protein AN958_01445 [Leucoagaricus sp. SymC.cos]|nr:hypothetical protein AN958_01445 [Leucoagaricus sp. SymC.cos]
MVSAIYTQNCFTTSSRGMKLDHTRSYLCQIFLAAVSTLTYGGPQRTVLFVNTPAMSTINAFRRESSLRAILPSSPNMYSQNMSQNMNYQYGFHADHGPAPGPVSDPNAPEVFKENLQIVLQNVRTLREHARRALAGIQNAYHVGSNPSQTQHNIAAAKQTLAIIVDIMRKSGAGALPLLETDAAGHTAVATEAQLTEAATKGVQANFEKSKRAQDSAAVVAKLLQLHVRR